MVSVRIKFLYGEKNMIKSSEVKQLEMAAGFSHRYGYYSEEGNTHKERYHSIARKFLRKVAEECLGLTKGQYDLRTNKAGPAVLGDTILHTDKVYVSMGGLCGDVLIRSCKSRKDYTGGTNHSLQIENLHLQEEAFIRILRACEQVGGSNA